MQKNCKNLSDNFRDIVIPFFKDDTNSEKVNHVKFETFNVEGCQSIMQEDHHVFRDFNTLERRTIDSLPALASARVRSSAPARTHARTGAPARARARASLPAKHARPRPPVRRKPSPPAAARQDVPRRGEENSVGYCEDDGPAVAQEFITASSTDLHNIRKHNSVI